MSTQTRKSPLTIAYATAYASIVTGLAHFFLSKDADMHETLFGASVVSIFLCLFLGFQVQPREMRPALFAFFSLWVHVGCWALRRHYGWAISF